MATQIQINTGSAVQALKDLREEQKKVKKELKGLEEGTVEYANATNRLNEINSKLEGAQGFRQLRQEQQALRNQLAGLTAGTQEYIDTSNRLGEVSNRINDINDTVSAVSNSPIENLSNSFGLLSGQVMNLDFEGATQSLSTFGAGIKNVKISDLTNGLKAFGKGLLDIGKALLANPIFLLVGAVTAIGVAFYELKDKIKPIGAIFDAVGDAIGFVVDKFKYLSDWIGISSFAAEEAAEKQIAAAKATEAAVVTRYDNEIKIAKAAGKNTTDLELKKQVAVLNSAKVQIEAIKSVAVANGKYTEEQITQLNELGKVINDASTEIKVIKATEVKDNEEKNKKLIAENDAKNEKILQSNLKYAQENKRIANEIKQLEISNIEDIEKRTIAQLQFDANKRKEEINNTNADAQLKAQLINDIEKKLQQDITNTEKIEAEKRKKIKEDELNKFIEKGQQETDFYLNQLLVRAERNMLDNNNSLASQIAYLEQKKNIELQNEALTGQEKELIIAQTEQKITDLKVANFNSQLELTAQAIQATQSLTDLAFEHQIKQANGNAEKEKAIKKKQFQVNKAFAVAQIILNTIMSITQAISSSPPPLSWVLAGINSALGTAATIKALTTKFDGGGATGGGGLSLPSGAGAIGGAAAEPAPNNQSTLFNESLINNGTNNGSTSDSKSMTQGSAVKVYVTETDISSTQNKVKVIENQAKF